MGRTGGVGVWDGTYQSVNLIFPFAAACCIFQVVHIGCKHRDSRGTIALHQALLHSPSLGVQAFVECIAPSCPWNYTLSYTQRLT